MPCINFICNDSKSYEVVINENFFVDKFLDGSSKNKFK